MDELEKKIYKYKDRQADQLQPKVFSAAKLLADIFSGIGVGGFIGYALDQYLNTMPFLTFLCIVAGLIGSLYNIYKDTDNGKPT